MNKIVFGILIIMTLFVSACTQAVQKDAAIVKTDTVMVKEEPVKTDTAMVKTDTAIMSYKGEVLGGSTTKYLDFNNDDYQQALKDNKIILLNFYATWCPSCTGEDPVARAGFGGLSNENAVGFRVNYKDSNTDSFETELAKEFGISYQHTKVIIKDGQKILKSPESWDKQRYMDEITKAAN